MCEGVYVCERASDGSPFPQAAKAVATSRGAGRDAEQSSALTASSKENHQEPHDAVQQLSTKVGVLSSAPDPELRQLGLRGWKGPLEVILSSPTPLLREGHRVPVAQRRD